MVDSRKFPFQNEEFWPAVAKTTMAVRELAEAINDLPDDQFLLFHDDFLEEPNVKPYKRIIYDIIDFSVDNSSP